MPQPHSGQQSPLNEIQMLQRQIMLKNLQELESQKKLQELNDARQQNLVNQQSLIHSKPAPGPPFINGTPVRDASHMFMFGNANSVHRLVHSQAQNQVLHSSFAHFQGPYGAAEDVTRSVMNDQFNIPENQERDGFGPVFTQCSDMGNQTFQELSGRQDQASWPGHFCEKTANADTATLDPLEQKILFNMDDDTGTGGFGDLFENADNSGDFPSLQSGSWSALMQSAVAEASSNDSGLQEEWSGSSFQNSELSNNNLQNSSSLSPRPELLNAPNTSSVFPGFQPHFPFLKDENMHSDSSHEQGHTSEFEFVNNASHSGRDFKKEFSPQRSFKTSEVTADSMAQTRHNMLELLHKVDRFGQHKHGTQPGYNEPAPRTDVSKPKPADAFPASPNFGLRLAPPSQRSTTNYFAANVWVDVPAHHNLSGVGSPKGPSGAPLTSNEEGSKMETASMGNNFFGHVMNSQGFDYERSQPHVHPQNYSFLNPVRSNPINATHVTSVSQLNPYRTLPILDYGATKIGLSGESLHGLSSLGTKPVMVTRSSSPSPSSDHLDLADQDFVVLKSKKRKFPMFEILPWHKEAAKGSSRLLDMSNAEVEWAETANRLPEKLKDEAEALGDSLRILHPKKRLTLVTQLMQLLFRPPPAVILSEDATAHYDTVTYFAARLALGDACSLANRSHTPRDVSVSSLEKSTTLKKIDDRDLLNTVEALVDQTKRLELELLRLESGRSILETRMESQELEKFSVINRFAKFHSRGQAESASSSPKVYPQRYVTASPMPRIVPEGQHCLLL